MQMKPSLFAPSLGDMAVFIGGLSEDAFAVLSSEIRSDSAFDNSRHRCEKIASTLGLSVDLTISIINACNFFYGRLSSLSSFGPDDEILRNIVSDDLGIDEPNLEDRLVKRLKLIVERRESADAYRKRRSLKTGFSRSIEKFSLIADLRPDFDAGDNLSALIPVIQLRISMEDENSNDREMSFQLDESTLKELRVEIEKIERYLAAINSDPRISQIVVKV